MKTPRPLFARPPTILYWVIGIPLTFVALCVMILIGSGMLLFSGLDHESDPNRFVRTGKDAKAEIPNWTKIGGRFGKAFADLPESAKNFWFYEGGNWNGSIIYGMFECESGPDCLAAVAALGGLGVDDLSDWEPSRYAVIMDGVDFYVNMARKAGADVSSLEMNPWNVREIKNGWVFERVEGDHRRMVYYAIDLDRNRVYYHYESGGFPADEYRPDGVAVRAQSKPN